jgi:TRAP-type C4-dicarboxylate transport system substrate-binding protein
MGANSMAFRKLATVLVPGLVATVLGGATAPAAAADATLKFHVFVPPVTPIYQKLYVVWANNVMAASKNRIKIDMYPMMQLGGRPPQLIDQVRDGVVEITHTIAGYTPGRFPKLEVFELPFIITTTAATNFAMNEFADKHMKDELADYKIVLLHMHPGDVFHSRKPIRSMDDFKGLKMRVSSIPMGQFVEAMGGSTVGAPVTAVPEMLSKGVIDGCLTNFEISQALKFNQMATFHTRFADRRQPRPTSAMFIWAMNKAAYGKLPADLKAAIDANSGTKIAQWAGDEFDAFEAEGERLTRERGNTIIELPESEVARIRKVAEPIHADWIARMNKAGFDGAAMLADARALVAKHTK